MRKLFGLVITALLCAVLFPAGLVLGQAGPPTGQGDYGPPEVLPAVQHDVSPPLRDIPTEEPRSDAPRERPLRLIPPHGTTPSRPDTALQSSASGPQVGAGTIKNFDGVGANGYAPPDTNGAVGGRIYNPDGSVKSEGQYVQWVNVQYAVYDKTSGTKVYGPTAGNTVWKGFGGGCETNNDGDPIVQYDKAANRWVLTQFSVSTTPYLQCVAISTSSDATGSYYRYAFSYGDTAFNDYPKVGVWPDGYYISFNIFTNGTTWAGSKICAYDRTSMLAGATASQQCFDLGTNYGGLLPSDLDGATAPPAGSPNYFLNFGSNTLNLWKFHVDWATPTNTTFTGPTSIPVAPFSQACNGGTCIPQKGTVQKLDSLADRLMYRLAYRNFGDHEALVVNHSVSTPTAASGVRWYELRSPTGQTLATGTPVVYQQGTYSPDATSRWMGSIAMDKVGNIALGYSVSSSSLYPGIRYTGRLATDTLNTLAPETSILAGGGSQNKSFGGLSRWGDYSSMSVDPVDDCSFWYTTEYLKSSGTFNWSTRIASFKLTGCQ